jgi:hypothetical protein
MINKTEQAYIDMQLTEGKAEAKTLMKMQSLIKQLMKEIDNLSKGDDAADLQDQIVTMDKVSTSMRDVILRASKVNPK